MFRRSAGHSDNDGDNNNGAVAIDWMQRGSAALDAGDLTEAEGMYRRALSLDDSLSAAWFDLGLIHKWRREWGDCLACNRRAIQLNNAGPDSQDPAFWNAGIAATAIGDWETARWAWRGFGIPIDDGAGEIEANFGDAVVRLPDGETVWGRRIDPTRMRLLSVPLPESGFRCGDVVLHDGAPVGTRVANGHEYSVFDLIEPLQRSPWPTVELLIDGTRGEVDDLVRRLTVHSEYSVEVWTESIQMLCEACSQGRVDYDSPDHDHPKPDPAGYTRLGCSGDPEIITAAAERWHAETDGVLQRVTVHDR